MSVNIPSLRSNIVFESDQYELVLSNVRLSLLLVDEISKPLRSRVPAVKVSVASVPAVFAILSFKVILFSESLPVDIETLVPRFKAYTICSLYTVLVLAAT